MQKNSAMYPDLVHNPFGNSNEQDVGIVNPKLNYDISLYQEFPRGISLQLTTNFNINEFECKCGQCHSTLVSFHHIKKLQKLRSSIGRPIKITSAYRCVHHNLREGGAIHSQHRKGAATDIQVSGLSLQSIYDTAMTIGFNGAKRYSTFIHLDSRSEGHWHRPGSVS
jgi:uncharacterized protein YcbK (DUF882 family)